MLGVSPAAAGSVVHSVWRVGMAGMTQPSTSPSWMQVGSEKFHQHIVGC
jgi:hypothetical protein